MLRAGVIGLGQIGGGVATCLVRSGHLTMVYDVRAEAAAKIEGAPPISVSPRALAETCDVVLIAVVDATQIRDVLQGDAGVLAAARTGMSLVILSTIALEDLNQIAALTDAAGVALIDCGVTGGPAAAHNGLVCLVGASYEDLARVKPVLDGFAKAVVHMGPRGAGMAAKIARNVVVYGVWRAGAEGMRLARAAGIDGRKLAEAIRIAGGEANDPVYWATRPDVSADPKERAIRASVLPLLDKDLSAALDLAERLGIDLPLAALTRADGGVAVLLDDDSGKA